MGLYRLDALRALRGRPSLQPSLRQGLFESISYSRPNLNAFRRFALINACTLLGVKIISDRWKFVTHAASLEVEFDLHRVVGFPFVQHLAAENSARISNRVVNCRRPWLHLGKGQ